jgi:hypothetical protein
MYKCLVLITSICFLATACDSFVSDKELIDYNKTYKPFRKLSFAYEGGVWILEDLSSSYKFTQIDEKMCESDLKSQYESEEERKTALNAHAECLEQIRTLPQAAITFIKVNDRALVAQINLTKTSDKKFQSLGIAYGIIKIVRGTDGKPAKFSVSICSDYSPETLRSLPITRTKNNDCKVQSLDQLIKAANAKTIRDGSYIRILSIN